MIIYINGGDEMEALKIKIIKESLYAMKTKNITIAKLCELTALSNPTIMKVVNKGEGSMENISKVLKALEIEIQ